MKNEADNKALLLSGDNQSSEVSHSEWHCFSLLLAVYMVVIIAAFAAVVEYPPSFTAEQDIQYVFYLNVTVMMLVGFGFLMTFQRQNRLTAVGMTFLITAMSIPLAILTGRLCASIAGNYEDDYPGVVNDSRNDSHDWGSIQLNVQALLQGNFAAAAVLISFGAVIGKLSPMQTALMAILEIPVYSFNKEILCIGVMGTLDMGGTIFIHLFGAYFGLAVSWMLGKPRDTEAAEPSRTSDVFSLIGTVFLWLYWPSFNGATAGIGGKEQLLTTVNTVMSLCASCITTFAVSSIINRRLSTVDVQNATLAGGVAIGASSNLKISPASALIIGTSAALVSTLGFNKLQPILEDKFNLHDSCGVHNLHGLPAILGSIAVTIAVAIPSNKGSVIYPKGDQQYLAQIGGASITLLVAHLSGLFVGAVLKRVPSGAGPATPPFRDHPFWTEATKED